MKAKIAALVTLGIFYMGGVYGIARLAGISSTNVYWFYAIMGALGLSFMGLWAGIKAKFQRNKEKADQAAQVAAGGGQAGAGGQVQESPEVAAMLKEAEQRLVQSKVAQGAALANMPLVFLIGDQGSTKTSVMVNSGIEPELLAGQVYQDNLIAPTRGANFWFARGAVFVEAGGKLLGEPRKWLDLIRKLKPKQLKTVAKSGQAPRGVVLCFNCEAFLQPNSAELVQAAGRYLQARLSEVSEQLGISFPVYVLFTKTDRIQFFQEYMRNLSREEATQVFGMTLPMRPQTGGVYGEEETRRLTDAFNLLFYSLADKRILLLPRETDMTKVPPAYEFPREFRKLRQFAVQFLVDVCRPSQLRTSPFLRGFYFSGVRPITVNEATPVARAQQPAGGLDLHAAATTIFRMPVAQAQAAAPQTVARRVPQWMFVSHLLNDIVLQDRAAMGASESSVHTSKARRILLSAASVLALFFLLFATISFFKNKSMLGEARSAAELTPKTEINVTSMPALAEMKQLETLRQSLMQMVEWERNGHPLMRGWGLYAGDSALPHVYRLYYDRFRAMLLGQLQTDMLDKMAKLPGTVTPADDFSGPYDTVKAYLLTTREHKRIPKEVAADWLASRLLTRWTTLHPDAGDERTSIAKQQFDFYAKYLGEKNPFGPNTTKQQEDTIDHAQFYLSKFSGAEAVYRYLLGEVARVSQRIRFYEKFPEAAGVFSAVREVDGPFTKDGWVKFNKMLNERDLTGERWVLGDKYAPQRLDKAEMKRQVLDLYSKEYVQTWRNFVQKASTPPYGGARDAANKLRVLAKGNQSPLLGAIWLTSSNTAVGDPRIETPFKPAAAVVPASDAQILTSVATTGAYAGALNNLQNFMELAADSKDPNIGDQTKAQAINARSSVQVIENGLPVDADVHLERQVARILYEPIDHLKGFDPGAGALNAKAGQLCQQWNALLQKYPFNPSAQAEATLAEVDSLLKPKEGFMWKFYEDDLQKKGLTCAGATCSAGPDSKLNPAFVTFFSRLNGISWAFYHGEQRPPRFSYALTPLKSEGVSARTVTIDGQSLATQGESGPPKTFTWPGTGIAGASLSGAYGGPTQLSILTYNGLWGAFRLFGEAEQWQPQGGGYLIGWLVRTGTTGQVTKLPDGTPLTVRYLLDLQGSPAFFKKGYFGDIRCVPRVTK